MVACSRPCQRGGTQTEESEPTEGGHQRDEREAVTNLAHRCSPCSACVFFAPLPLQGLYLLPNGPIAI